LEHGEYLPNYDSKKVLDAPQKQRIQVFFRTQLQLQIQELLQGSIARNLIIKLKNKVKNLGLKQFFN
jgi:hypothetical protein